VAIAGHLIWRAAAARLAEMAAGAGVHRRDQLEGGREIGLPTCPGDMDAAAFQRFA
jgi:hypothetical protein